MANIFQTLNYKNKPSRSAFDLSSHVSFTAKAGELLPVYTKLTIPGDKFQINLKHYTRTQPVNTAAFTRFREYFDFYFVPQSLMWRSFKPAITQMTTEPVQAKSLTDNVTVGTQTPYLTLASLYGKTSGLLHLLRSTYSDAPNQFGFAQGPLTLKLLSYLRYGDVPEKYANPDTPLPSGDFYTTNEPINPFPLAAYQKIYFDWFRNTQWEDNSAFCWNFDYNTGTELHLNGLDGNSLGNCLFTLRYCNYPKDLFFGILPNSQFGDVATVDFNGVAQGTLSASGTFNVPLTDTRGNEYVVNRDPSNANTDGILQRNDGGPISKSPLKAQGSVSINKQVSLPFQTGFSILALRQAEALQRWKEVSQSGDKNFRDQIYKHWGVTLPFNESDMSRYLGGVVNDVNINEVVSNAIDVPSDGSSAGRANIAGKGFGSGQGVINFETQEYGVLMCIYHITPLIDYDIDGIDLQNFKTDANDYAIPEFDHIGMETLPTEALSMSRFATSVDGFRYLGYVPRYIDYKTSIDYVLGAFKTSLKNWVAPIGLDFFEKFFPSGIQINKNFFKVNPSIVDPIFGVASDSFSDTDQFLINVNLSVNAVRNLDFNGMPY